MMMMMMMMMTMVMMMTMTILRTTSRRNQRIKSTRATTDYLLPYMLRNHHRFMDMDCLPQDLLRLELTLENTTDKSSHVID